MRIDDKIEQLIGAQRLQLIEFLNSKYANDIRNRNRKMNVKDECSI
jgi:hypothetical protein